jgi:hypothetical protein
VICAGTAVVLGAAALALGYAVELGSRAATTAAPLPYENATIADTGYPIPAGALFVANSGRDANPGTIGAPFATIRHALGVAPAGATIVVRGGVYRESLGSLRRRVTIQAYPHEQAWVRGSVVATRWAAGQYGWSTPFDSSLCDTCYPSEALTPSYPAAGLPEQVFVDGVPQRQVTNPWAMGPGAFMVSRATHTLWLGDNPAGHTVEITVLGSALAVTPGAAGTKVLGLGFEHWGAVYQGSPYDAITSTARFVTFDNDTIAWSAGRGLGIYGDDNVVTNSRLVDDGMNGLSANRITGLDFEHNEIAYSNYEHWDITPTPYAQIAGAKLTGAAYTMMRDNDFHDNYSNGLWFDQLSRGQTIVGNTIVRNAGHGLTVEVSGQSAIVGNLIADNGRDGLKISGANDVEVWNNTSVDNGWAQIGVYEDPRHTQGVVTSDTSNVSILDNVFEAGPHSQKYVFFNVDTSHPKHATFAQMISADDHNVWGRTNPSGPAVEFDVQSSLGQSGSYDSLAQFHAATGRETASTSIDGLPLASVFSDPVSGNFSLLPSALAHMPAPLSPPIAIAWALGPGAIPQHVGAA